MKCCICGKEIERSLYSHSVLCSEKCFDIHFWNEIVKEKDQHLFINGKSYKDGGTSTSFLGFDGRRFHIRKFDGTEIVTNNLWCQGEIPEEYRDILQDNAEFLQE